MKNYGKMVDELGKLDMAAKALEKQIKAIKEALKATGLEEITGKLFEAKIATAMSERLDIEAIREEMPAKWVANHSVEVVTTTLRIKPIATVVSL